MLFVGARAKAFYLLASVAASGYALSIPLFGQALVPQILAPLPELILALAVNFLRRMPW